MNIYLNRYNKLINHYKNIIVDGIVETHHIIPRCMGGNNSKENLVRLSPKAHFVAHHLLHKAYPNNIKLAHAFGMMLSTKERIPTAALYEKARIAIYEAANSEEGKISRKKGGYKNKGRKRPDLAKRNKERKGEKRTKEQIEVMKQRLKGRKFTEEHLQKLRKPKSEKHRQKIAENNKIQANRISKCPHCGHVGKLLPLRRYHFNNCKNKKDYLYS
jgi:DNA-directed RNA polymerase subunit M/transcription elongation factor TFIIS